MPRRAIRENSLTNGPRLPGEHEKRSALLRILSDHVSSRLSEPVEPASHVDRLRADEDPNACGDHPGSHTESRRWSAFASKLAGTRSRRPLLAYPAARATALARSSQRSPTGGVAPSF